MNISVVGLGKLGAPLAAVLASKGHNVIGADVNEQTAQKINTGIAPVFEPGLDKLLSQCGNRLRATTDGREAVMGTDVTFMVVNTPSEPGGGFSLRYVKPVAETIGRALAKKTSFHLVVLTSTVMPGATGGQLLSWLEAHSGKVCGRDFGLCYNPEFIALGSVIRDMLNPDFILIGESDPHSGDLLQSIHEGVCDNTPAVQRMNFVNAELTKLAINTFVTTKITYANMLARVCERLPGADADVVTSAVGLDSRIGKKYLKGAVSYGGPCFPRDNRAFAHLANQVGARATLAEVTDHFNRQQIDYLAELAMARLPRAGCVGVLGLSYKPDTDVVEESVGVNLANRLAELNVPVCAYDPKSMPAARSKLAASVHLADSLSACVCKADVLVVTVTWEAFRKIARDDLRRAAGRVTIIDCWRMLDPDQMSSVADYVSLGMGPVEAQPESWQQRKAA